MQVRAEKPVQLYEGTWALPKTPKEKAALKKLLSKPLRAKDATDKIYDIIGDDELADDLDDLADRDPNDDARELVRSHMKRLGIKEYWEIGTDEYRAYLEKLTPGEMDEASARADAKRAMKSDPSMKQDPFAKDVEASCLLYTSPSPRDRQKSRMPSSA